MASDGIIQYQYDILAEGVDQMQTINSKIRGQVADLTAQTAKILTDWTGSAASAYDSAAKRISNDLTDSNNTLLATAQSVNTGTENMGQKDRQLSNMFN
jgi:WXG100 family type VII secretion target